MASKSEYLVDLIFNKLKNYKTNFIFHTFKRVFEFICSLVIFILFMPIIILFSILIFFQDGYPPFYSQKRTGLNGKEFEIVKIRSMNINAEKDGPRWSQSNDQRVTRIGFFDNDTSKFLLLTLKLLIAFFDKAFIAPAKRLILLRRL